MWNNLWSWILKRLGIKQAQEEVDDEPVVDLEPADDDETTVPDGVVASNRLLWKPIADNTGALVILLPADWNFTVDSISVVDEFGVIHVDNGRRNLNRGSNNNGWRRHYWFKVAGESLGTEATLVVTFNDGEVRKWRNAWPANRTEKDYTKLSWL